jgi:hypothetical protein
MEQGINKLHFNKLDKQRLKIGKASIKIHGNKGKKNIQQIDSKD